MDEVKEKVSNNALVIFSRSTCCMCDTIKILFANFGANATVYELDQISDGLEIKELSRRKCETVPVVFIGGELVGEISEVNSLHLQRKLIPMLKTAKALWV